MGGYKPMREVGRKEIPGSGDEKSAASPGMDDSRLALVYWAGASVAAGSSAASSFGWHAVSETNARAKIANSVSVRLRITSRMELMLYLPSEMKLELHSGRQSTTRPRNCQASDVVTVKVRRPDLP